GFLLDGDEYVLDLVGGPRPVDRRGYDGGGHEQHVILCAPGPSLRVVGEFPLEGKVGAPRIHQGGLVVGRAAYPAIAHARPGGDGVTLGHDVLTRTRDPEELVGEAA